MSRATCWTGHAWIALGARLYLGTVLLAACIHKIADPGSFALDVATYQMLPLALVNPFALLLPWVELATGLLLIVGFRVRAASLLTAAMMVSFMIALGWALHQHFDISCGCFASQGAQQDPISWHTVVRDSAWLLLTVYVLVLDRNPVGLDRLIAQRRKAHG